MFGKEPVYTGMSEEFLDTYGANTELGRLVRSEDAKKFLEAMEAHEEMVRLREQQAEQCSDRIEQMLAQHRLSAEYIISFGIPVEDRQELKAVMEEVAENGGLSIRSAIGLASARSPQLSQN